MKARKISLNRLVPNPQRLQRGGETLLYKLRQHIDASGCYEPIVVRPHPNPARILHLDRFLESNDLHYRR
jgi:hypothetical protein